MFRLAYTPRRLAHCALLVLATSVASQTVHAQHDCEQVLAIQEDDTSKVALDIAVVGWPPCQPGPPPPPPPPPPSIPLDSEYDQVMYDYDVRFGDFNSDGLDDVYIKRLDGHPDNGVVYESVALQTASGSFTVAPSNSSILQNARTYPVATDTTVNKSDMDGNGYTDPTVAYYPPGIMVEFPVTFVSSGQSYGRSALAAMAYDESVQRFDNDLAAARLDPTYFDDAKEPDELGFNVTLTLEVERCEYFGYSPFCIRTSVTRDLGFFSLEELGVQSASGSPSETPSAAYLKPQLTASVISAFDGAAVPVMAQPTPQTYVDSDADAAQAKAYFGLSDGGTNQTLQCVVLCGTFFYYDFLDDEIVNYRWYDTWVPTILEGDFDDANYSREAYDAYQAELLLDEILAGPANSLTQPVATQRVNDYHDRLRRGYPWPVLSPTPAEQIQEILDRAAEDTGNLFENLWRRYKIWRIRKRIESKCANAEDHQDCLDVFEDEVLSEVAEDDRVGGVWDPNDLEDWDDHENEAMREWIPILAGAATAVTLGPGRWQCSYIKYNARTVLPYANWRYYGITSILASRGNCFDAVPRRSQQHDLSARFKLYEPWHESDVDVVLPPTGISAIGVLNRRGIIRGREQQLIDSALWRIPGNSWSHGLESADVFNRIRSVSRINPRGCPRWLGANLAFGSLPIEFKRSPVGPYTGWVPSTCLDD